MTLKRQYRMENGRLKYYVDTQLNIDDGILLDLLSAGHQPPHAPGGVHHSGRTVRRHPL